MLTMILGRAGTGKTNRIFKQIAERVAADAGATVLLVPEQYSHEAERELCAAAGDRLSASAEVMSFTGLARKVFADCGGARPTVDAGGRLLCMAVAVEQCAGALKLYGRARRDVPLLTQLLRAIDELKNAGVDGDMLAAAIPGTEGLLYDKLSDLALLLEAFNAVQAQSGADAADTMELLAELIGQSSAVSAAFYVDGFTDFTALEQRVLTEIIASGADITLCLSCDGEEGEDGPYALPRHTARWLRRTAEEHGQKCETIVMERGEDESALDYYCAHLFDFTRPEQTRKTETIQLVTAGTIYEECELAAARMRTLAMNGCRWRDMAVAVRGFEDYRGALESACAAYDIPLFLSGRGDILRKSLPLAVASALECVSRGWEYEAVFSYLKTGLAGFEPEELDELENYVILWNIRGRMWRRSFTLHPEGYNREATDESRETLAQLNALRERIVGPLGSLEDRCNRAKTARQQAAALADFWEDISLAETLEVRAEALSQSGRETEAMEYRQLWELLCSSLEQFARLLGDMPMDTERFAALWSLMISRYDLGVIPVSLDRVQAGEMDKMRRRHIRHLLVLGATDERLPAPDEGGSIFSEEEREALDGQGLSLPGAEQELGREFGVILNCLTLPSDSLYLSRALTDAEGGETRPSLIVNRAGDLLGAEEKKGDLTAARMTAPGPARSLAVLAAAGETAPACGSALQWAENRGEGDQIRAMADAALQSRGQLSAEAVQAVYGKTPALTASRAEKFNSCRFGYFLQYGLRARPRQKAVFDPRDYGSFLHEILKGVAADARDAGGFSKLSREDAEKLADKHVDRYIAGQLNDFAEKTPRFIYLFRRLRRTVRQVCGELWEELSRGQFVPLEMELDLSAEGVLSPDGNGNIRFFGIVDRVDGWVHDGALYLRVTDYKTGVKKFSLSDLCRGMDMQMLLYLFTLSSRAKDYFGVDEIRPAGVLYSPARAPMLSAEAEPDEEELAALRRDSVRRSGLVLDDPEVIEAMEAGEEKRYIPVKFNKSGALTGDALVTAERFGALERYIQLTLEKLAAALRSGSVEADPWFKNARDNACTFCDYADACLFDDQRDGWRPVEKLKTPDAWERIEHGEV